MPKTPGKMHMYDVVKIDTIVCEIVGRGTFKAPPHPRIVSCLKYPGSIGLRYKPSVPYLLVTARTDIMSKVAFT